MVTRLTPRALWIAEGLFPARYCKRIRARSTSRTGAAREKEPGEPAPATSGLADPREPVCGATLRLILVAMGSREAIYAVLMALFLAWRHKKNFQNLFGAPSKPASLASQR